MSLTRFKASDLICFLEAIDRNLDEAAQMTVIGGSAAALGYKVAIATVDIDTYSSNLELIHVAAVVARTETGLEIPLSNTPIADVPYNYEDRLVRVLPRLEKLQVWVLEKHDLALSKIMRAAQHDLQQLTELHGVTPLELPVLVNRYKEEMDHVIGQSAVIRLQFLLLLEALWGVSVADAVDATL